MDILKPDPFKMAGECFSLEDYDNSCKALVSAIANEDTLASIERSLLLNPPFKFAPTNSMEYEKYTSYSLPDFDIDLVPLEAPENTFLSGFWDDFDIKEELEVVPNSRQRTISVHSDIDQKEEYKLVSPNTILPVNINVDVPNTEVAVKTEPLDEVYFDLGDPEVLREMTNELNGYLYNEDKWIENRHRPISHMDNDHCYSAPPPPTKSDDEDEDFFNSSPCSPGSSTCSEELVVAKRAVKKSRAYKKSKKSKKSKTKVLLENSEEVDVETIPFVPKIKITVTGRKRGRKPYKKNTAKKQRTKDYQNGVSAKILRAAISKKSYVTKSGRVTKINNSVETSPSSSTPSSLHSSRCNSDNEDVDKRASHNMAERNRRQELTNLFQNLRRKVPEIKSNSKASKVSILQSSTYFVRELEEIERQNKLLKQQLQAELEKKIAILKSFEPKNAVKVEKYSS